MSSPEHGRADRSTGGDACPDEGTLVAFLDGALGPEREREVADHLDAHAPCRAGLEELRRRDRAVTSWIEAHDPTPPPRDAYDLETSGGGRSGRPIPWWAAAAAVLLVVAALAGPGRAWVADGVRSLLGGPGDDEGAAVAGETSGATALVPGGDEIVLTFTSPRTRGHLRIVRSNDARLTLREPDPRIRVTVGGDGLRVENEEVPAGDYRVEVPRGLRVLRVRVPGGAEVLLDVTTLEAARTVEIGRPDPSPPDA